MAATATSAAAPRRTQAERRAATRAALLEATIACLAEEGYAHTTTRRIAERAGVTPGAQQHHFATKSDLVAEALNHAAAQIAAEVLEAELSAEGSDLERAERLLDLLWELHKSALFHAAMELMVAARTDPELRARLEAPAAGVAGVVEHGAAALFPELGTLPDFIATLEAGLAMIRGLALQSFIPGPDPEDSWPAARAHLLETFARIADDPQARRS
jgi:AcrR family transcriptional regulator